MLSLLYSLTQNNFLVSFCSINTQPRKKIDWDKTNKSISLITYFRRTLFADLPQEVDNYHELCPLEPIPTNPLQKAHLGYQASMYKATHVKTGTRHCLRRIHGSILIIIIILISQIRL